MKIKELAIEVREHIRSDFHPLAYSAVFLLAVILISINYSIDFERKIIRSLYATPLGFPAYIGYYMLPYFLGLFLVFSLKKAKTFMVLAKQP